MLKAAAVPGGSPANGIFVWFTNYGGGGWTSFLPSQIKTGTWDPNTNRMRFKFRCAANIPGPGNNHNIELGTYVKGRSNPDTSTQGAHYYHFAGGNVYANRWVTMEFNRVPQHQVSEDPMKNWPEDPEYQSTGTHYFDGMTHFYWTGSSDVSDKYYGTTCYIDDITTDTVSGGADNWVSGITLTYNGSAYEATWQSPKQIPLGVTYDIRYSQSSMRSIGFSNGTSGGTIAGEPYCGYCTMSWVSGNMPEATSMYVAIRPRIRIKSISSTSPMVVTTFVGHNLASGDGVTLADVQGIPANGTWTITKLTDNTFSLNGSTGSGSHVVNTGTATTTDDKKNFAEIRLTSSTSVTSACDVNGDGTVNRTDVDLAISAALAGANTPDLNQDGKSNVTDTQRIINAYLGSACRAGQ
jgi:hypothetical protein